MPTPNLTTNTDPTVISALDLRKGTGRVLDEVFYKNQSFVIERAGKPKAALVPVAEYEDMRRRRLAAKKRFAEMLTEIRENLKDVPADEWEETIAQALKEVRAKRRR